MHSMNKKDEQKIKEQFGSRLKNLRQEKGMTQEALALLCDLDRTYIGSVERGERNISLVNIHKIAKTLGVDPRELFKMKEH